MSTIIDLFEKCVKKFANNDYLLEKHNGSYKSLPYFKVKKRVDRLAAGLLSLGVEKGDRIALLAEGQNNWVISELAIFFTGAVNVPLSIKLNDQEIKFRLAHAEVKYLITTSRQLEKITSINKEIPALKNIILIDTKNAEDSSYHTLYELSETGKEILNQDSSTLEMRKSSVQPDDIANICYTSGTTADPKGILLSHLNYVTNIEQSIEIVQVNPGTSTLLILPWDHAFAHTCGVYAIMASGASIASIELGKTPMETLKNIPVNIREVKPDYLLTVPALAKNFRKNIEKNIRDKGKMAEKLFNHALQIAYKYNGHGHDRGKGINKLYKPLMLVYDKILFSKIREGFGGKLKFFVGGGALLDMELQRFFYAIGMPMLQGYGLTEAAPVISANSLKEHKLGSSGKLVKNLELKICDEEGREVPTGEKGEIVIKGNNVMLGYWRNETATNETIKNGWLYTGDMGFLDKEGYLYVLGRFKSLLIGDDGEKFSPEGIEEALVENSRFIDQCMLYNNQNPYTSALLYPNKEALKRDLMQHSINPASEEAAAHCLQLIEGEINRFRKNGDLENMFPQRWIPAAVGIISKGFTEQNNMLNSTMKMVRDKITATYDQKISDLYTPGAKNF
ncbi:MAG: AMP-binding protein, partial [Bacteroidetes bacterium]|nr:AMP-binding protein [Bacteroidota bacterium]